jgi:hypothetical protein
MGIRTLRRRTATTVGALLPSWLRRAPVYAADVSTPRYPADHTQFRSPRDLARAAEQTNPPPTSRTAARY